MSIYEIRSKQGEVVATSVVAEDGILLFRGVQCSEVDMSNQSFARSNFDDAIIINGNLKNADFSRSSLRKAKLLNCDLEGANFSGCDLSGIQISLGSAKGASFVDCTLFAASVAATIPPQLLLFNGARVDGSAQVFAIDEQKVVRLPANESLNEVEHFDPIIGVLAKLRYIQESLTAANSLTFRLITGPETPIVDRQQVDKLGRAISDASSQAAGMLLSIYTVGSGG